MSDNLFPSDHVLNPIGNFAKGFINKKYNNNQPKDIVWLPESTISAHWLMGYGCYRTK